MKQLLRLKLPIDKDEATRMLLFQLCMPIMPLLHELCKSGWSLLRPMGFDYTASSNGRKGYACDDSNPAWQDSVEPGMCMMLWSEKYSHMYYSPSSGSIIGLSSFLATGYKVIDASFIQQMSVLKSLQNL